MNVVKIAKELVAISSERNAAEVGNYLYRFLKELGLKPFKQPLSSNPGFNVVSIGKGRLLVNGHMDTVPIGDEKAWKHSPYGEVAHGKLYGRGSCDTKGNIAMLLAALAERPEDTVTLTFSGVEEGDFDGIETLMKLRKTKLRHIKYGITLEPMDGKIHVMSKGQYTFEVRASGKAAHSSRPQLGDNAIEKLAPCIERLKWYAKRLRKRKYKQMGCPTLNIGLVSGGSAINVVPDEAKLVIDRRVLPNEKPAQVIRRMQQACRPLKTRVIRRIEAAETPLPSRIVSHMQRIHRAHGLDGDLYASQGTTELTGFRQNGIEGAVYGWGKIQVAHAANEYIDLKALEKGKAVCMEILAGAARL